MIDQVLIDRADLQQALNILENRCDPQPPVLTAIRSALMLDHDAPVKFNAKVYQPGGWSKKASSPSRREASFINSVGGTRLELVASTMSTWRSSQLS